MFIRQLFSTLVFLSLPFATCMGRTVPLNLTDPSLTVLEDGDTLLVPSGAMIDGCLTISANNILVTSSPGELSHIWTCSVPSELSDPYDTRAFGNCIVVKGRGVTIERILFQDTLCDIPEDHPYIGSFETMWMLGAVRIDPSGEGCTVRECVFEDCGVGVKSNAEHVTIENNRLKGPSQVLRHWNWGPIGIWLGADHQEVNGNFITGFRAEDARIPWKTTGPLGADGGAIEIDDARAPKHDIHIHHNFSTDNQGFLEVTFSDVGKNPGYSGFRIHDNVSDDYQSFVLLWSGTECLFEDNVILRRKTNGNEQAVFRFTDPSSHNTVRNNTIITKPGIDLFKNRKGTSVTFEDNRIYIDRNNSNNE